MYLFKQIKVEKDAVLVGKAATEDLDNLTRQGYQEVLDIMPRALKDKGLARRVRSAGMIYRHIPVEDCNLESCHIEEEEVVRFFQYLMHHGQGPVIINTDDEVLGISLILLNKGFGEGRPQGEVIRSIEELGISLKGRKDIRRFIRDFYKHYQKKLIG
jgi:protein tyrosine phosphatase (PTP) superfamily phosphohydrolase (DUF442 family)